MSTTPRPPLPAQNKEAHSPLLLEHPLDIPRTVRVPRAGHDILWASHERPWIVTSDAQVGNASIARGGGTVVFQKGGPDMNPALCHSLL